MKKEIEILKQQFSSLDMRMGIAEKNLQLVAESVNDLKYAFQQQKERRLYLSIATFGLSCFGVHALVDAITNIADLSDLAEVGSVVLQVPMEQSQSYLDGGLQALDQNKRIIAQQGAGMALKGIGLDPNKFIETWITANIVLHGETPQDKQRLMAPAGSAPSSVLSSSSFSSPVIISQNSNQFFSATLSTESHPVYSSSSSSSSSSTMNTQNSSPSFFAKPSAIDGIILQEISESEFKVGINYPKLRLSPQQRTELQEVLTGNDGTGAFSYIEASAKTVKGAITELSFEDKDSADILIAELNRMIQAWKLVSTPKRLVS